MNQKSSNEKVRKPDPMFDGHIEKPLSSMTPGEKLDYIWLQMMFRWKIRSRIKLPKPETKSSDKR